MKQDSAGSLDAKRERIFRSAFLVGVWLKGFNGFFEILGGIALLFTGTLTKVSGNIIGNVLEAYPDNLVALHLQDRVPVFLAESGMFAAIYLFSHGVVKIILAAGLVRNRLWAYPSAIAVFTLFVVYQLYRFAFTHSIFLLVLTVVDLIVIWLTWHEYRYLKKHRLFQNP